MNTTMASDRKKLLVNSNLWTSKMRTFRKGDLYRDPRINQVNGQKDFLMIGKSADDLEFLRKYVANEHNNWPCEKYDCYTTGVDKNGTPLVGLYEMADMDMVRKALICCTGGSEEDVLAIVDEYCEEVPVAEEAKGKVDDAAADKAEQDAKGTGSNTLKLPPGLVKYQ